MENDAKHQIVAAYQQLVSEGGYQVISVTEVSNRAGVSRATFYYHFRDIYDLVEYREREFVDAFFGELPEGESAWSHVVDLVIDLYESDALQLFGDYAHLDRNILRKMHGQMILDIVKRCFRYDFPACDDSDEEVDFFLTTLAYALTGRLDSVLDHSVDTSPREYFKRLDKYIVVPFREHMDSRIQDPLYTMRP